MNRIAGIERQIARNADSHRNLNRNLTKIHDVLDKKVDAEYFDSEVLKLANSNEKTREICLRASNVGASVSLLVVKVDGKIDAKVTELQDENRKILSEIAALREAASTSDSSKSIDKMIESQLSLVCKLITNDGERNTKACMDQFESVKRLSELLSAKIDCIGKNGKTTQETVGNVLEQCQKVKQILESNNELDDGKSLEDSRENDKNSEPRAAIDVFKSNKSKNSAKRNLLAIEQSNTQPVSIAPEIIELDSSQDSALSSEDLLVPNLTSSPAPGVTDSTRRSSEGKRGRGRHARRDSRGHFISKTRGSTGESSRGRRMGNTRQQTRGRVHQK